ncbi:MAG: hypothetical protein PHX30_05790 [Candidatus Pacebacteria bacterium]|jgi:predicted anti-sigma-YlaC factor YlaD|nr:hypothetical protein [Candidatus Paceibacterota bacterium]
MEETAKNPLELSCKEAAEIIELTLSDKATFMEKKLLEAHLKKCGACRQNIKDSGQKAE